MALTIWGRLTSSNVQKLLWGCAEMGVPFERPDMAGKFGFTEEYLAMNPNRVVPTIDDDSFILWESNACLRYLAEKYGRDTLWPEDRHVRADADRWMDWATTTFWNALRPVFHQLIRTAPENRNMDLVAQGVEGALAFSVRVCDVRQVFGRVDYEVEPVDGSGRCWVSESSVRLVPLGGDR